MTDPSQSRKKKKLTIIASEQGVEKAEKALIRFGIESKRNFAKSRMLSRSTVTKFFNRQPIQLDTFKKICEELELNWREIAGIPLEQEQPSFISTSNDEKFISGIEEGGNKMIASAAVRTTIDVIDKENKTIAEITLQGDSINNLGFIQSILQEYSGNTIKIIELKTGSIKLFIEGSQEDIQKLREQIKSKKLKEIDGLLVEDIQILGESFLSNGSNAEKWNLVREIRRQGAKGQNLSGIDLSDADLGGTDFRGADLSNADFSNADLIGTNLSSTNLRGTDFSNADLSDADLSDADFRRANLKKAVLTSAKLTNVNLTLADISGADLSNTDLNFAIFIGTKIDDKTNIEKKWKLVHQIINSSSRNKNSKKHLREEDLSFAYLDSVDLKYAKLQYVNFEQSNLNGAFFESADLRNVVFKGSILSGADLRRATVDETTNFEDANVSKARFGNNFGLPKKIQNDLTKRGAIFEKFSIKLPEIKPDKKTHNMPPRYNSQSDETQTETE